jgi:hypothetical protein
MAHVCQRVSTGKIAPGDRRILIAAINIRALMMRS